MMRRKKNDREVNLLSEYNQKSYRVAAQKEKRRDSVQATYKLVRNVLVIGVVVGVSIYIATMWFFQEVPMKEVNELDNDRIAEIIAEITKPITYDEVAFRMNSEYALLINITNDRTIFAHQADVQTYPASVTKIMTIIIGLENGEMDESVTVNADFEELFLAGAMQSGFTYGEVRTLSEILYAIMLPSGAEATWSLANHVAGSYDAFVDLMNEKAQELGMSDTNFVTATGLHDDDHYTTADDIAILMKYALANPEFREIFTAQTYELETPNSLGSTMHSTLFNVAPQTTFEGGEILGGRTGFTPLAGRCLASLATNGIDEFILITFGADDPDWEQTTHILDALMIYEYFLEEGEDY